jgi:RimJ/RimL family protein N-acetyltransferase
VRSLIHGGLSMRHDFVMTNRLTLRPVSEDDLPLLQTLTQDPEATGEFGWFGWFNPRRWRRGWDENGLIGPDGGTLMVIRDDGVTYSILRTDPPV